MVPVLRMYLTDLKTAIEPLAAKDYIHAHAVKDSPDGQIEFMTKFPKPGKDKLWGQFNRNGKIIVADFWVDVQ